jgi:hypothetical protein
LLVVVWVVAKLPDGVTAEPVVEVWVLSVTTPLTSVVCCMLLELDGAAGAAVVDWVVELVDVCATATPVIITRAADAASQCLIMLFAPWHTDKRKSLDPVR